MKSFASVTRAFFQGLLLLVVSASGPATIAHAAEKSTRPNIIIIMSDDMGFSDLGCYGGEINTPNLDKLAGGGVRFTQFYNTARCCPTRAALLTGLYSHQAGIGHMMDDRGTDGYRGELSNRSVTIAEALKPAGYRNYVVGKWHVTKHIKPDGPKFNWPLQRGFDRYYGTVTGAGSFFDPGTLTRDNTSISPFNDSEYTPASYYYTDALGDHAVRFVTDHKRDHADQPFFMYVAFTAAHWPMHAKPEDIAKYKGKYDVGYEPIRKARLEKAKKLGLIDPKWELTGMAGDWNSVTNKAWEARCMEVYAAMIDCMDQNIGKLVASLEKNGQRENTLIMFLQDNGACAEPVGRNNHVARPAQPTLPVIAKDALRQDVIPTQDRDGFPTLQGSQHMPGPADTYIAYGKEWANVSNTPFREYKHWEHEGGISTPLIASWPAGIPSTRQNALETQPGHLIDLLATCVDLAGAKYPAEFKGQKIQAMEGVSLRAAFNGQPLGRRQPIFWEHEGNRAVREGQWKIVSKHPGGWELYDMAADRTEMHDLAAQQPDRVKQMAAQWETWSARVGVQPWPLPAPISAKETPKKGKKKAAAKQAN